MNKYIGKDKDSFSTAVTNTIKEKISGYIDWRKEQMVQEMFLKTICEDELDEYLLSLDESGVEYIVEDGYLVEFDNNVDDELNETT